MECKLSLRQATGATGQDKSHDRAPTQDSQGGNKSLAIDGSHSSNSGRARMKILFQRAKGAVGQEQEMSSVAARHLVADSVVQIEAASMVPGL